MEDLEENMDKIHRRLGSLGWCETSNGNLSIGKDGNQYCARG
jgi:hypothetical protein